MSLTFHPLLKQYYSVTSTADLHTTLTFFSDPQALFASFSNPCDMQECSRH